MNLLHCIEHEWSELMTISITVDDFETVLSEHACEHEFFFSLSRFIRHMFG